MLPPSRRPAFSVIPDNPSTGYIKTSRVCLSWVDLERDYDQCFFTVSLNSFCFWCVDTWGVFLSICTITVRQVGRLKRQVPLCADMSSFFYGFSQYLKKFFIHRKASRYETLMRINKCCHKTGCSNGNHFAKLNWSGWLNSFVTKSVIRRTGTWSTSRRLYTNSSAQQWHTTFPHLATFVRGGTLVQCAHPAGTSNDSEMEMTYHGPRLYPLGSNTQGSHEDILSLCNHWTESLELNKNHETLRKIYCSLRVKFSQGLDFHHYPKFPWAVHGEGEVQVESFRRLDRESSDVGGQLSERPSGVMTSSLVCCVLWLIVAASPSWSISPWRYM